MKATLRRLWRQQFSRACFLAEQLPQQSASPWLSLTCTGKTDGGGAQWHAVFSVLCLAQAYGIPFRHTPLRRIEHGPVDDPAWSQAWNQLFDLEAFGVALSDPAEALLACADPLQLLKMRHHGAATRPIVVSLPHAHRYSNLFPSRFASLRPLLRQAYRPRRGLTPAPLDLQHTLVVHVRRGDVQAGSPHQHRFTSAAAIAAICSRLQARHPQLRQVLLLSASADSDLLQLCREGFLLDSHHDVFTHLHWMSQAAGLVMARSSLSYLAAMLNPNLVFYDRFEHPPLPGWIQHLSART